MVRSCKKMIFLCLILIFVMMPSFADTLSSKTLLVPSPRTAAIGGSHAALGDDLTTLSNNPAGLYGVESQFHVTELTFGLSGPVFSLANIILRGAGGEDTDELLTDPQVTELMKSVYVGAALVGPLSFGYAGKGLGFFLVNNGGFDLASLGSTTYAVSASDKTTFYGGYAFRLHLPDTRSSAIDVGVNLKTFIEGKTTFKRSLLEIPDLFSEGGDAFMNNPFSLTTGIGIDIGTKYHYSDEFSIGLVGRDVFTPTTRSDYTSLDAFLSEEPPADPVHGIVPFDLSLGLMYSPRLGRWERYFTDFKILLDYRDIVDFLSHPDTTVNPILKLGFGTEIRVLNVLLLRAGFNEGLLAGGIGLDYGVVKLNIAMYGSEKSIEPGLRPVFNMLFGVEIRL